MKKKAHLLLALALAMALVGASPATAAPKKTPKAPEAEVSGGFKMTVHSHSNNDPVFADLRFPTDRLSFGFVEGSFVFVEGEGFSYSSRRCDLGAPFNEVGLDFSPDYPGVDDDENGTAAVRHHVQGTVTEVNGRTGTIEGTITSVLCENNAETGDRIITEFVARYRQVSNNELALTGTFRINPELSTGTFADLEGHGSFKASLTCLGFQRDPSKNLPCSDLGHFTDFVAFRGDPTKGPGEIQPGLVGSFRDPTVTSV